MRHSVASRGRLTCVICNARAKDGHFHWASGLCIQCLQSIPWIHDPACVHCGRATPCPDCRRRKHPALLMNRSAVTYTGVMKDWLARYKYRGDERLGPLLAWMMEHAFEQLNTELCKHNITIHALTYVPLSEVRNRERSFNQAEQLARYLARRHHLQVLPLLQRQRHTERQSRKGRADRLYDLEHTFSVSPDVEMLKCGCNILIVDDVYTTGSTMHQCAKALKRHASINVFGLTWAR